ncbi:MAG: 4-hydroxy-tetrahydrodipicolinate reductase, partial [Nitrospirota bacterium]
RVSREKMLGVVIGTTGFSGRELDEISDAARIIPIVISPNMSIGINLIFKVIDDIARRLSKDYDIEIVEAHHRLKKDAPSGTAMRMARILAGARGLDLDKTGVYSRKGMIGERGKDEIGIQTIRAGDIVGEHTVIFGGTGERIEVTHKAHSRDNFAKGAIIAASWLAKKDPGLYDMMDVLGLRTK